MKIVFRLFLMLALANMSAVLAQSPIAPQDPAFLDGFNAQQKKAIYYFLSEELGNPIAINDSVVSDADLKQLYTQHLENWSSKAGVDLPSISRRMNLACTQKNLQAHDSLTQLHKMAKSCRSKRGCSNAVPISSHDIDSHGVTIKKKGYYCLKSKKGILYWNPSQAADVITIDADDVILDLSNTTIIQKPGSGVASTAINILPGHKNITIRNGNLVGFVADSIVATSTSNLIIENIAINDNSNRNVYAPSIFFGSVNVQLCQNVILQNIVVSNAVIDSSTDLLAAGILILGTQTFLVENCEVVRSQLNATTLSQYVGISTILSTNGVLDHCRVSNCTSSGIMPGFGYVISQSIESKNCIANYNTGVQTTSGYYPQLSDSLSFINCEASNNHSTCQDCHGFPYFISTNGFFSNCRASNNIAVNPSGQFNEKVTGFEILVCRNCIVETCEAYNNTTTNPIRHYGAGFANGNSINVIFRNCISIGNNAIGNTSRGVGFGPALDPRFFAPCFGTIWENCIAEGNFGDAQSIGFDLFGQIDAILSQSTSQSHGSLLVNNGVGILSDGPYDEGNPVDVPCNVVPIIVITANAGQNILVKNNTVANNSFAGIMDTTDASNAYMDNIAFNNGTNFIGPIFAEGTPIRNWTVQSPPSNANNNGVVGDNLDNMNITTP